MGALHTQATALDALTGEIACAYSRLSHEAQIALAATFAGGNNIQQAYDTAHVIVNSTDLPALTLVLARLLVMTDDEVGVPVRKHLHVSPCAKGRGERMRRRIDRAEG